MKRLCLVSAAALIAVVFSGLFGTAPAAAETAAEFYQGKVVKLVVGYGPGGGYDLYARMLAPHLERSLGATVVVENRTGGGGLVVISQLANGDRKSVVWGQSVYVRVYRGVRRSIHKKKR